MKTYRKYEYSIIVCGGLWLCGLEEGHDQDTSNAEQNVLLYSCETWSLHPDDIRHLVVFDRRCLCSMTRIAWSDRVGNIEACSRVFGAVSAYEA